MERSHPWTARHFVFVRSEEMSQQICLPTPSPSPSQSTSSPSQDHPEHHASLYRHCFSLRQKLQNLTGSAPRYCLGCSAGSAGLFWGGLRGSGAVLFGGRNPVAVMCILAAFAGRCLFDSVPWLLGRMSLAGEGAYRSACGSSCQNYRSLH